MGAGWEEWILALISFELHILDITITVSNSPSMGLHGVTFLHQVTHDIASLDIQVC